MRTLNDRTRYPGILARIVFFAVVASLAMASEVRARCIYVTAPTAITFTQTYSVFGTGDLQGEFTFQIQCNPFSDGRLSLSRSGTNNSYIPRQMMLGSDVVNYNVYLDAAGTQVFGNGTNGTTESVVVNATPQDKAFDVTMYFRVPQGADVAAGTYTDTLTLHLTPTRGGEMPQRSFTVSVTVVPECQVQSFSIPFGDYDPIAAHLTTPLDANTIVNVLCTKGVTGQTALSSGDNPSGAARQMAFGANRLLYNVFIDSARTSVWDTVNRISATSTSKLVPLGGGLTGYGRIPAGQTTVLPGAYVDTLVATVTY